MEQEQGYQEVVVGGVYTFKKNGKPITGKVVEIRDEPFLGVVVVETDDGTKYEMPITFWNPRG